MAPARSPEIAGEAGIVDVMFIDASFGWLLRGDARGELLATTDGGGSWTVQYTAEFAPQIVQFVDADNGWLAGCAVPGGLSDDCQTQLLSTTDGGSTWAPVPSPPVTEGKVVAIAAVSPQDLWVLAGGCSARCDGQTPAQLLKTRDGGTTWEPDPLLDGVTGPVTLQRLNGDVGWVMTRTNVFGTSDGGLTWVTAENPCTASLPGKFKVFPGQLSFVDAHVGWLGCLLPIGAGTSAGALFATGDGGATWHLVGRTPEQREPFPPGIGRVPTGIVDLDMFNAQDGWFASGGPASLVWRTRNGGQDWEGVDVGPTGVSHVLFVDDANGWAWGFGTLLSTPDGGASWVAVQLPP